MDEELSHGGLISEAGNILDSSIVDGLAGTLNGEGGSGLGVVNGGGGGKGGDSVLRLDDGGDMYGGGGNAKSGLSSSI